MDHKAQCRFAGSVFVHSYSPSLGASSACLVLVGGSRTVTRLALSGCGGRDRRPPPKGVPSHHVARGDVLLGRPPLRTSCWATASVSNMGVPLFRRPPRGLLRAERKSYLSRRRRGGEGGGDGSLTGGVVPQRIAGRDSARIRALRGSPSMHRSRHWLVTPTISEPPRSMRARPLVAPNATGPRGGSKPRWWRRASHQRLQEPGLEAVVTWPVYNQLLEAARQDGAGQAPHLDPQQQLLLTTCCRLRARVSVSSRSSNPGPPRATPGWRTQPLPR